MTCRKARRHLCRFQGFYGGRDVVSRSRRAPGTAPRHITALFKGVRSMKLRHGSWLAAFGLGVVLVACAAPTVDDETTDSTQDELRNNPCMTVRCAAGYTCKRRGQTATCVPNKDTECTTNADCRRESNYCGGCNCLALATGESAPTCSNPVNCFADPCSVTSAQAACVGGQCVLQ